MTPANHKGNEPDNANTALSDYTATSVKTDGHYPT